MLVGITPSTERDPGTGLGAAGTARSAALTQHGGIHRPSRAKLDHDLGKQRQRNYNQGWVSPAKTRGVGTRKRKRSFCHFPAWQSCPFTPRRSQRLPRASPGAHPRHQPSAQPRSLTLHSTQREEAARSTPGSRAPRSPSGTAWPRCPTWRPIQSSRPQLCSPRLFTSFWIAFWSEGCSRDACWPCQQDEIAVIAGS